MTSNSIRSSGKDLENATIGRSVKWFKRSRKRIWDYVDIAILSYDAPEDDVFIRVRFPQWVYLGKDQQSQQWIAKLTSINPNHFHNEDTWEDVQKDLNSDKPSPNLDNLRNSTVIGRGRTKREAMEEIRKLTTEIVEQLREDYIIRRNQREEEHRLEGKKGKKKEIEILANHIADIIGTRLKNEKVEI